MKNRTKKIKVVVTGATGRMGQMLVQQILADKKLSLFGATERPNHKKIGSDIGDVIKSKKQVSLLQMILSLFLQRLMQ